MAQAEDSDANHDCVSPWQQTPASCKTVRSGFSDVLPASCIRLHTSSTNFPEIQRVAEANEKRVHGDHVMDCITEEPDDFDNKEDKQDKEDKDNKTSRCTCRYDRSAATDHLKLYSKSSRQCHCSPVLGGEIRTMCAWGELERAQSQNSGLSVSKRKQFALMLHRPGPEDKYNVFEFQHLTNSCDYIVSYRTYHTVADVGRTSRRPPRFGLDLPDPYAVRIKNICSVVTSCDLTALITAASTYSCADFNSVISADKSQGIKAARKDKSRSKEGSKTGSANIGQAQSRPSRQPGDNTPTTPSEGRRDVSDYMQEYNEIRRERGLQKMNTLPIIRTRLGQEALARPNSTERLLYELRSPFTRVLQQKRSRSNGQDSFTDDFPRKHSSCFKLSEFLTRALSGDACVKSSKTTKPGLQLKAVNKSNTANARKEEGVCLPELVGQTLSATSSCTKVMSLAVDDVKMASKSVPASAASEHHPAEYRMKKRHIPDLMFLT